MRPDTSFPICTKDGRPNFVQITALATFLNQVYITGMTAVAIIVAAGSGQRFGSDTPKQFLKLGPLPVWQWSYDLLRTHSKIDEIVVVLPPEHAKDPYLAKCDTVDGGHTRAASVLAGLNVLQGTDDTPVLIHDAARPGLTGDIVTQLLGALETADGAAPALPVNDALKRGTSKLQTVDRTDLYRVQTPQAFRLGNIKTALSQLADNLVDDLEAIERTGGKIKLIEGDERLMKITRPSDLEWLEKMLIGHAMRTGTGFDVHKFEPGDAVTLCGIAVPHTAQLQGHSDADVAWHALTDAILGALALGDIGDHFPPSDATWKNAASSVFLKHAAQLARDRGFQISNLDITLVCEAPKIKPHRQAMRQSTADCLGISLDRVSVKATTTEGLGFTGRREGIAAQASVCLTVKERG